MGATFFLNFHIYTREIKQINMTMYNAKLDIS